MKLIMTFIMGLLLVGLMAACQSVPTQQTPAQIAAQVCPNLKAVSDAIHSTPGALSADDLAKLDKAEPIIAKVCAATAVPAASDLQSVAADAVPILLDVVEASTLPGQTKLDISLGVNLAKAVISQHAPVTAASASQ